MVVALALLAFTFYTVNAFHLPFRSIIKTNDITMNLNSKHQPFSLRSYGGKGLNTLFQTSILPIMGTVLISRPGISYALSQEAANEKLGGYELPPILFIPPGFTPLVSEFGRGNAKEAMRNPIIVQFCHPNLWIQKFTSINNNGEAGTISANDYIKGDSSFLFIQPLVAGEKLSLDSRTLLSKFILKSLSQKGDPVDSFVMGPIRKGPTGTDGTQYYLADISYVLNTEAGFMIGRKGVVSVTSVGGDIQGLISVTTDKRYKTLESSLRDIANTFRVYKLQSGIFSNGAGSTPVTVTSS